MARHIGEDKTMFIQGRRFSEVQAVGQVVTKMPISPVGRRARAGMGQGDSFGHERIFRKGRMYRLKKISWKLIQPTWGVG